MIERKLPVNLVVIAEGDEERMSIGARQFMKTHGSIMVSPPGNPRPWTSGIWK